MKPLWILFLTCAAAVLGWIAFVDPAPDHLPHRDMGGDGPIHVPAVLLGERPEGASLVEFVVDGPCCAGCSQKLYGAAVKVAGVVAVAVRFDGNDGLAYGQAWLQSGQEPRSLLSALTFGKYSASERRPEASAD